MNVSAVLVEQLEPDGHLLTFQMRPEFTTSMTVAFANEYADPRVGPFHFLDPKDEQSFKDGFATGKVRQLSEVRFKNENGLYKFHTSWLGIPTTRGELSYYALSLPEFAVPEAVQFSDPRSSRPYGKTVIKDKERHRFVLYLECRSSHGSFDFQLDTTFRIDEKEFKNAVFHDQQSDSAPSQPPDYAYRLSEDQQVVVQQFFAREMKVNNKISGGGNVKSISQGTERLLAFGFGVVFVVVMLGIALFVPYPSPTQWFTFRVVLALAAAGVGALLPGLISVTAGPYVKAGGALALFVLVYWFNPARLVTSAPAESKLHLAIPSLGKPFGIEASMAVSGNQIERKTIPHPLSKDTDKGPHSFYTESNGGPVNSHLDVCPMAETGWVVDTDGYDGFDSGMTDRVHVIANGSNYWEVSKLGGGCLRLYCDGRNGSSNVHIANVFVREKRSVPVDSCHAVVQDAKQIKPGEEKQLSLDVAVATGSCLDPKLKARIDIKDSSGSLLLTKYLEPNGKEEVFDGALVLQLSPSGLIDVQYRIQSVNP
jgi:hypothetical protein